MADGGMSPKDKHKSEVFEYEEFGTPMLYLWAAIVIIVMNALLVMFALLVAGGAVAVSEALNG